MENIISAGNGVGPACIGIEIGRHKFDRCRVRSDLADGRSCFFGPRKVSYCRANAPAVAE